MTRQCSCHPKAPDPYIAPDWETGGVAVRNGEPDRWPYKSLIWLEYVCLMAGVLAVVVVLAVLR